MDRIPQKPRRLKRRRHARSEPLSFLARGIRPRLADFSSRERRVIETVNRRVAAAESLDALLEFFFSATRTLYPCDRLSVAFVEEDGRRLVSHWVKCLYRPVLLKPGYAEDLDRGSLRRVVAGARPRIITDLAAYAERHPDSRSSRLLLREGVRSSMTCPMKVDGRVVGVLFRSARRPAAYDAHQVRLHLAIAERLSQAVEKAYRIEQFAAANHAYAEMLAFVSHELQGPLAGSVTDLDVLLGGYAGALAPPQGAKMASVRRRLLHLQGLVRDYLALARVEGKDLRASMRHGVNLSKEVIEPAVEAARPRLDERHMRLTLAIPAGGPTARCDPALLRILVANLLDNAAKYGRDGGAARLSAGRADGGLSISLWNEGPGFPAGAQSRLFRRFSRVTQPEFARVPGTGVGLYTCWRIAKLHGGTIRARSKYGQWAEFVFEMPIT